MSGAATVALAVGPAAITGAVGYWGARLQSKTTLHQIDAENQRLRATYGEAAREQRQASYNELMTLMYRLDAMMAGFAPLTKDTFERWLGEFLAVSGGIELCGGGEVRGAMVSLGRAIDEIGTRAGGGSVSRQGFEVKFAEAYLVGRAELINAVGLVAEKMRGDIALEAERALP